MTKKSMSLGEEKKSTSLAKFLRILRIQNDELLGDMAKKIGIMPSYLSSIEANRRPLTKVVRQRLVEAYGLNQADQEKLDTLIVEADRSLEVELSHVRDETLLPKYVDTALLFAKDLSSLGGKELDAIQKLLKSFNKEEKRHEKTDFAKNKTAASQRV